MHKGIKNAFNVKDVVERCRQYDDFRKHKSTYTTFVRGTFSSQRSEVDESGNAWDACLISLVETSDKLNLPLEILLQVFLCNVRQKGT